METTDSRLLKAAAGRASRRPGFLAYDLARFHDIAGADPARWLGVDHHAINRLALCRTPRRGHHFSHDVVAIAAHVGTDPIRLASVIRLADVLSELQERAPNVNRADSPTATALAAARDESDEHTVLTEVPAADPGLPGPASSVDPTKE